jgi:16S rRNA (cytosine967-C5)-methyltransferase
MVAPIRGRGSREALPVEQPSAPVYARINQLKTTVPEFLLYYPGSALLPEERQFRHIARTGRGSESGRLLHSGPSTALACETLRPVPGETVLDACAAPGGKATYLAEIMQNQGILVAADQDETRPATFARQFR